MNLLLKVVLLHISQAFLFIYCGLGLVGARPNWRTRGFAVLLIFLGVVVEILRRVAFPFHSILLVLIVALVQKVYFRVRWGASLAAVFLSFILLNLGEALIALTVLPLLGLTLSAALEHPLGLFLVGWASQLPLMVAAFGVGMRGWVLFPLETSRDERGAVG